MIRAATDSLPDSPVVSPLTSPVNAASFPRLGVGLAAVALAAALPSPARLMGTSLWAQDPVVAREPALADAWFPGPDPAKRG